MTAAAGHLDGQKRVTAVTAVNDSHFGLYATGRLTKQDSTASQHVRIFQLTVNDRPQANIQWASDYPKGDP